MWSLLFFCLFGCQNQISAIISWIICWQTITIFLFFMVQFSIAVIGFRRAKRQGFQWMFKIAEMQKCQIPLQNFHMDFNSSNCPMLQDCCHQNNTTDLYDQRQHTDYKSVLCIEMEFCNVERLFLETHNRVFHGGKLAAQYWIQSTNPMLLQYILVQDGCRKRTILCHQYQQLCTLGI